MDIREIEGILGNTVIVRDRTHRNWIPVLGSIVGALGILCAYVLCVYIHIEFELEIWHVFCNTLLALVCLWISTESYISYIVKPYCFDFLVDIKDQKLQEISKFFDVTKMMLSEGEVVYRLVPRKGYYIDVAAVYREKNVYWLFNK